VIDDDSAHAGAFRQALADAAGHEARGDLDRAFASLERAHVLGQTHFASHWHVHSHMLRIGWARRDAREVFGQLLRLALVPIGHLSGRLPIGNTGGANVSAFRAMPVPPELQRFLHGRDR
jgi:hypothetical protein